MNTPKIRPSGHNFSSTQCVKVLFLRSQNMCMYVLFVILCVRFCVVFLTL